MEEKRDERQKQNSVIEVNRKICDYLGVSLSYFFAFDEDTQTDVKNKELTEAIKKLNKDQILF